jgi:hypothetical protein
MRVRCVLAMFIFASRIFRACAFARGRIQTGVVMRAVGMTREMNRGVTLEA